MKYSCLRTRAGFSLVEVTISLAIVAAVLLPLIAILSQGGTRIAESEDRFAATRIVQSIESEINYSSEEKAFFLGSAIGPQQAAPTDILLPARGGGSSKVYLGFDRTARLIREISPGEFSAGLSNDRSEILYLVEIKIDRESKRAAPGVPPLYRMQLSIEQPAFTAETNRSRHRLQTRLSGQ